MNLKPKREPSPPFPHWGALGGHKLPGRSGKKTNKPPSWTNTWPPSHAGLEHPAPNYCRGQRFNTLVERSCYSVWRTEIRTFDNEISVHLVITRSSQPETKGNGPVASIDSLGLLLARLLSSSPWDTEEKQEFWPRLGWKSFAVSLSAWKVITFPHTHEGSIQEKCCVSGGAHLTVNVLNHSRSILSFLNVVIRQLWCHISLLIHRLFSYRRQRKRLCDSHRLSVWLRTK